MSDKSAIEWTDATWNPTVGCTKVSAGCDHCYAEGVVTRWHRAGSPAFPQPFDVVHLRDEAQLRKPLHWRKPRRIFVNSLSDLFHADIRDTDIARVWAVMAQAPQHTFQVLTKRHARMRSLVGSVWFEEQVRALASPEVYPSWPLENVWLGVSIEDQKWADIRVPALLETPTAVRWVSAEPLLGPVYLSAYLNSPFDNSPALGWVVAGGESGPAARPMHPDWARGLRDQCAFADVPFLFKQWGGRTAKAGGRRLDGRTHDGYPSVAAPVRSGVGS